MVFAYVAILVEPFLRNGNVTWFERAIIACNCGR